MATDTDIAYCAGLIDGEGCIRVKRSKPYRHLTGRQNPSYGVSIQIRMVDEPAIRFLAETLGGWYYKEKAHLARGRPLYCWQASDIIGATIIRTVRPYLKVKAAQADATLALRDLQAEGRKHRTKITGYRDFPHWTGKVVRVPNLAYSDEYIAQCEALFQQTRTLNQVGA